MQKNAIEEIKQLHATMRDLTLQAGVGIKRYDKLIYNLERKLPETITRIHTLLTNIYNNEWKELNRIWTLPFMTPEVWGNYFILFDANEFDEVKLLKAARKALKEKYVAFWSTKKTTTRSGNTKSPSSVSTS